jgi:hypothetical protein
MPKVAIWIAAGSLAVIALGAVVVPFGMGVAAHSEQAKSEATFKAVAADMAAEPTAEETFRAVAESMK